MSRPSASLCGVGVLFVNYQAKRLISSGALAFRHGKLHCLAAIVAWVSFSIVSVRGSVAADPVPDLDTIRTSIDSYASAIRTLSGKYRHTMWAAPEVQPLPNNVPPVKHISECQFEVDITRGHLRRECFDSAVYAAKNGEKITIKGHETRTWDGVLTYALQRTLVEGPVEIPAPQDHPIELRITDKDEFSMSHFPWDVAGLRRPRGGAGLAAFLRDATVRVDGVETLDDVRCIRIVAEQTQHGDPKVGGILWVAWLDSQHGFLPRRMEISERKIERLPGTVPDLAASGILDRLDVVEFGKYKDLVTGSEVWFPRRAQFRSRLNWIYDIEVLELKINPALDRHNFVIDLQSLPDGVRIWDSFNGEPARVSYTGGRADLWKERNEARRECNRRIDAIVKDSVKVPP